MPSRSSTRSPRSLRKQLQDSLVTDPIAAAKAVGLRYVSDEIPGIRRQRAGKGFRYLDVDGTPIRDRSQIQRFESLGIPPAYQEVWICPLENGHLQATGRDARGRKQYRYHELWRQIRSQTKFTRMLLFSEALPKLRQRLEADLSRPGLPKEKVLATVLKLMEITRIRVGNEEYARSNNSFGLTTLRDEHADVSSTKIRFQFRGKSGVEHDIQVHDRQLARIVKQCQDIPGQELFQYLDEQGQRWTIDSADVNAYLQEITGQDFTAKDFRTWAGTVYAVVELAELGPGTSETAAKKNIVQAIKQVAHRLGNRPATCRKYYVHPAVLESYLDDSLHQILEEKTGLETIGPPVGLSPEELAVVAILEQQLLHEQTPTNTLAERS